MPVIVHTQQSQVSALWGRSYIRDAQGKFRLLALGDVVQRGDVILTEQNAIVRLDEVKAGEEAAKVACATGADTSEMDRVIAGLECNDPNMATAAGNSGSSADGGLQQGERVERVREDVSPAAMGLGGSLPLGAGAGAGLGAALVVPALALGTPTTARISSIQTIRSSSATEDQALVFPVQLDTAGTVPVTVPFEIQLGSASPDDITAPIFSNGVVLNAGGTITIPAGISDFVVTVPLNDDTAIEDTEGLTLRIAGQTATGTIRDNDIPSVVGIEAGDPGAAGDQVIEGESLVYTVSLSTATAAPSIYPFVIGGGSATADDRGQPSFSDGVQLNGDGTLTVPAGVTRFTVTVPTVDDSAEEAQESLPLSVGGVSALGFIADNDGVVPPTLTVSLGDPAAGGDRAPEGSDLVFAVQLSAPTTVATTYPFSAGAGSANADDVNPPVLSNGVVVNADGTITVPPGVSSFTVSFPTVQDALVETDETLSLTIDASTATGTIVDDDRPSVERIDIATPNDPNLGANAVTEGGELVYTVRLSATTVAPTTYPFTWGDGSAGQDDRGEPVFSDGVVLNPDGTLTVPAGVSRFTVTVPTVDDTLSEATETLPLSIDNVSATGAIIDNDRPAIEGIDPPPPVTPNGTAGAVTEGSDLVYTVRLSQATGVPTSYPFTFGNGTATADDVGQPEFSDGVTLNADGTITVPAGVSRFTVTVPTIDDSIVELTETVPLSIDGVAVTASVIDNDRPSIDRIDPAPPATPGATPGAVIEGEALVYTVSLSQTTTAPSNYAFSLGGGSADANDLGSPVFSNGVTLNADGSITVPAGVSSFTVTLPTVDDSRVEVTESVPLSIDGVTAAGIIEDNDKPEVVFIEIVPPEQPAPQMGSGEVQEGGVLNYRVQLNQPTVSATVFPFSLGGGTALGGDFGAPSFSDGVVLNPDGTITVPPNVTSFNVLVPTTQDTLAEPSETLPLTIDSVSATGIIVDDDRPQVVQVDVVPTISPTTGITALGAVEGADMVYNVRLSQPTAVATVYSFAMTLGTASADDVGAPVFTQGVQLNGDGTITVPAGVESFSVVMPSTQDLEVEATESMSIRVDTVVAQADILDDDRPAVVRVQLSPPDGSDPGIDASTVTEGGRLCYSVQLDQATVLPTRYAFGFGGGTAGADDLGQPVFSNGVVLNADGTITVPPGVSSFTIDLPTIQDTRVETDETVPLHVDQVDATGTVLDDDQPSIVSIAPATPGAGDVQITEGQCACFAVTLGEATAKPATYAFSLGGGSAEAADLGTPVFSDGVTLNADGTITVPAGVVRFTVTVPTVDDTRVEPTETVPLSIGGISAEASIVDNDRPTVVAIEPSPPGADPTVADAAAVSEGAALGYRVQLSEATAAPSTYSFAWGGGTAGQDDLGQPVFSDGVVLNADGTITVPAGVSTFTVSLPTVDDRIIEARESVPLRIDTVEATGYIVDNDRNAAPTVQSVIASVSEEGLAGGLVDSTGLQGDTGDAPTVAGRIGLSDAEGQAITQVVLTAPTTPLSSGGVAVEWSGSGSGELIATAGGERVATLSIDSAGAYQFTLHKPLDHPSGQGEDVLDLDFGVLASDGSDQGVGALRIQVEDDAPVAANVCAQVTVPHVATNVMVVLDVSGSMGSASGIDGLNRLQAAVKSIETLLDRYAEQGDVAVRLVTFGTEGQAIGDRWSSVVDAKALMSKLCATGGTNYDDALADAMSAFGSPGRIGGGQNVSYFLSDGAPTFGSGNTSTLSGALSGNGRDTSGADVGIQADELRTWTAFLDQQGIHSHAMGIGTGITSVSALDPIAYNGQTGTETRAQLVTHLNDLPSTLLQTTQSTVSGSLWTAGANGPGADGGHVQSFTLEGVEYRFDPTAQGGAGAVSSTSLQACSYDSTTKTLTVSTRAGGSFTIDLDDGHYTYCAPAPLSTSLTETFGFTLVDGDGDRSSAQGQVVVEASVPPPPVVAGVSALSAGATEGQGLVFEVRTQVQASEARVNLALASAGATVDVDTTGRLEVNLGAGWVAVTGDGVVLPPGTSSFQVRIETVDDRLAERPEGLELQVTGADGSRGSAVALIHDNDEFRARVVGQEDTALPLSWAQFSGGGDVEGSGIRFQQLPADGKLQAFQNGCWHDVCAGQTVSKQLIDAAGLRFVPDAHESGADIYGVAGVGNGKSTYVELGFAIEGRDGSLLPGQLEVDINPVADAGASLHVNTLLAWSSSGAPSGHQQWESLRADGSVAAPGDGLGHYGMWHRLRLDACSSSGDRDGSEEMFYQVRVNQVDGPGAPTVVALQDGTILQPAADGAYWVPADAVDSVLIFRQWGQGPNGQVFSHQSATTTVWNAETDGAGNFLDMVKGNTLTSTINTPLVLDLDGDGVETVSQAAGARFDFNGDGNTEATGWVGRDDGLLVLDRNGDGQITSGRELFGDAVTRADGSRASDGYAALGELDSNRDGRIDARDESFAQLKVWRDGDTDGQQEAGELLSLGELGISSLSLDSQASSAMQNGNQIALVSSVTRHDGSVGEMADVWFGQERADSAPSGAADSTATLELGYEPGMVGWVAAAESSESGQVVVQAALPADAGLDLRDLLGGDAGGAGQGAVQLDALLGDAPQAAGPVANPSAVHPEVQASPVAAAEQGLSWSPAASGAEDKLLQELLNPNKLDNGC